MPRRLVGGDISGECIRCFGTGGLSDDLRREIKMPDRSEKSGETVANESESCDAGTVLGTEFHNCEAPACFEVSVVSGGEFV